MNLEKWQKLSKEEQILNIAAELSRVKFWLGRKNSEQAASCLGRALDLVDLTADAARYQKDLNELLRFREILSQFYINEDKNIDEFTKLFKTILMLNKNTSLVVI